MVLSCGYGNVENCGLFKQQSGGEDPFVLVMFLPVGIHMEAAVLQEIPLQLQVLAFDGLTEVANHKFPDGVFLMVRAGEQVVDPV